MGKKKSAKASVEKLSRGLARETPASQTAGAEDTSGGPLGGTQETGAPAKAPSEERGAGRSKGKPDRMVRVSVDLPRPQHKYLRDFAYDAESDGMSVMRALLREMSEDEDLAARVRERLAGGWR